MRTPIIELLKGSGVNDLMTKNVDELLKKESGVDGPTKRVLMISC
jgi:hypothetical protein